MAEALRIPTRLTCFGGDRSTSQLVEKIEILNTKLDTIINLLSSAGEKKSKSVENKTKKSKKSKNTKEKS